MFGVRGESVPSIQGWSPDLTALRKPVSMMSCPKFRALLSDSGLYHAILAGQDLESTFQDVHFQSKTPSSCGSAEARVP